jgi:methionine synthase II (cobalamin-independent)
MTPTCLDPPPPGRWLHHLYQVVGYPSTRRHGSALAIAKAYDEDFKELGDNGCDIIQLDEFVWPYGMGVTGRWRSSTGRSRPWAAGSSQAHVSV